MTVAAQVNAAADLAVGAFGRLDIFVNNAEIFRGSRHIVDEAIEAYTPGDDQTEGLTSDEHFSVDGTLIEEWASQKSFRRKDGTDDDNPDGGGRNAGLQLSR